MTKRRRDADPEDAAAETAGLNTVFVDTSLDTHLAMLIRSSDTVSDFKKKVALEHMQCFPEMGEIQVHSVKVKRRSNFYHLPDIMLVWSAFHGVNKNWFLSVDASSIHACQSIRNSSELGAHFGVKTGLTNIDDDFRGFTTDANRNDVLSLSLHDGAAKKNEVSEMIVGPKVDKPVEKAADSYRRIYSEERFTGADSPAKKKRKVSHRKDAQRNPSLEGGGTMFHPDGKDRKPTMSDSIVKVSGVRNDQYDVGGRLVSEGISPPTRVENNMDFQNTNGSDEREENNRFDSNCQHSGIVSVVVPDSSARQMDVSGGGEVGNTTGIWEKKKIQKTVSKIQDTTDIEHIGKGERIEHSIDANKCDQTGEGNGFSLKNDDEVMMPSNSKAPGQADPNLALTKANILQDAEKSNSCIVNSQKISDFNGRKEANVLESKLDIELDQDVPTVQSGGACTKTPKTSARLVDAGGGIGDVNNGKKRKKKKIQATVAKVQDTRDDVQIGNVEIEKPHSETINIEEKEEEKGLPLEHDYEVILPSDSKVPDNIDPDLALKDVSLVRDVDAVVDTEISSGTKKRKKKKRGKKPLGTIIEHSGITEIPNGIRGSLGSPSSDHVPKESGKEENIRLDEGKDVQMKLLDGPNHDPREKEWDVNRRETDLKTQTERTVVDVNVVNKKMVENTKISAGDYNADFPTAETVNAIMESNQADKDNGNAENGDLKVKKKRKKKHTATDVQQNHMVKDQQVGIELLETKETPIDFVNSEQKLGQLDSSQILSHKSEEKVNKMHELVVNTDDLTENSTRGSGGINFKQYFVPGQLQNEVASGVKVSKGTKAQRSSKKAKDNDSPSVNVSTELHNSISFIEYRKTEKISTRKHSGKTKCDSTQNSDWDEISKPSFDRSSETPKIELKDSRPAELRELTGQKANDVVAAPIFQNKNPSLDKSSPKKKILLAKSSVIFQDNSGESSGDENRIMHSDDSTLSPSDSSSMSGDSIGETEVSQNSTCKGSNDTKGKPESKLESASKDMTMEMILRSSKRFKKAREVASQTQNETIEFVPDTQTQ